MRTPNEKQKFLDILTEIPNISIASKRAGIAKSTIYRWNKNKIFAKKMEEHLTKGRDSITDVVESQLINQARKGEFRQMKFWLENNCKRYIRPRPINIFPDSKKNQRTTFIIEDFSEPDKEENKPSEWVSRDYKIKDQIEGS